MQPSEIRLDREKRHLSVAWERETYLLEAEYLRIESPSAEVKGHGIGQGKLVSGKRDVLIQALEPVGNYAVKIVFSDGHATGIFTWDYLKKLGEEKVMRWNRYEAEIAEAGLSRDKASPLVLRKHVE